MRELPLVSIGIPTYNQYKLPGRTIESAGKQGYPDHSHQVNSAVLSHGSEMTKQCA